MWRIDEVFDSATEESVDIGKRVEQRSKRQSLYIYGLILSTGLLAIFSMGLGSSKSLSFSKIIMIMLGLETPTDIQETILLNIRCLLYTSPSPRDGLLSRMPSSA